MLRATTELVVLDALVQSRNKDTVIPTLEPADFVISEDGVPQTITNFSHDQAPLSVVFLFDVTGSVWSALQPLAAGAREILGHLKSQDEVAVMVFSSHTELLQRFTIDRSLAAAAIQKASTIRSKDGTFIHEDMWEAVDAATKATVPESRRVLVWLTDGTTNLQNKAAKRFIGKQAPAYLHSREEAMGKLLHSGVVVSALIDKTAATTALVLAADTSPFFLGGGARLGDVRKYADATGGPVLNTSKTEVAARLAQLIDQIRTRYTIGYKPSVPKPDGTFCKLKLELRPEWFERYPSVKKAELVIRTKSGYYR